ncbi:LysR substrate-binding domain-containing protein [Thalassospira tepidiphila]|uniref:LysR family transcriptional regulator n=2 Tax=Thalassospira tepidiphila TaxID=393657 RepID=A0A853L030_9PROT|nr:LysR substrate-binding domain-containing protein [Thalassospira tepidiphila]NJB76522.1 DNA-binding transcriptional LysR family regulator [Thalassospira tepidiphila]OAZ09850.1 LysR family transcriptional regulator [Thalassospira tepidiphila MCCC 1A03514]
MDTRQLKTLVAVSEQGTFARAAEIVHLTPSAVSQQMQALEQEMGVSLFNRDTRPPTLNAHGLQLLETAHSVLRTVEETRSALHGERKSGTLSIGSVRTSTIGLLPKAIVSLRSTYPDFRINLRVGLSSSMISDVQAGRLDMAIVAEHLGIPQGMVWRPFIREPLIVIAPLGTPDMDAREILETLPFVRFRANVPLAHLIDLELSKMGIVTTDTAEIDTISAIVECVVAGLGATVVPHIAVQGHNENLLIRPFGDPQVYRQIGVVQRMASAKMDLMNLFHDELASLAGEFGVPRETSA